LCHAQSLPDRTGLDEYRAETLVALRAAGQSAESLPQAARSRICSTFSSADPGACPRKACNRYAFR
jgi:hypothetical protein